MTEKYFSLPKQKDILGREEGKTIHFFDLDGTLWQTEAMWRIKDINTGEILLKITQEEGEEVVSGKYLKSGIQLPNSIYKPYISLEMWERALRKSARSKPETCELDFAEFKDQEEIEKQKERLEILYENFSHINNSTTSDLGVITARGNKKNHMILINTLIEQLEKKNGVKFNEDKIYFLSDEDLKRSQGSTSLLKGKIILEHIIGLKIKDYAFTEEPQDLYDNFHFYDDEWKNIKEIAQLFSVLFGVYEKTPLEIKDRIKQNNFKADIFIHHIKNEQWKTIAKHFYNPFKYV